MSDLYSAIEDIKKNDAHVPPQLFDLSRAKDEEALQALLSAGAVRRISDDYEEELLELFGVRNPALVYTPEYKQRFAEHLESLRTERPLAMQGRWAYFPWSSTLTHILPEEEYRIVRTARNRLLITEEEQQKFYNATIGIGGLSVGSSIAFALVLQGAGKHIKLADMDQLALSNTNRVLAGSDSLGLRKVVMAARRIYEMNPYASIELFSDGLTPENIEQFFDGLDIVIDELDTIAVKYLIREQAKKHKIAVIMGADNGDNAVIDIERYDLNPDLQYFNGRLGDVTYDELLHLDKFGIGRTITRHIGPENITLRMQESLLQMGKTIVSWPQLGGAALINGAAVAYCVRKVLNGQELESDRALISLDEKLDPAYHDPERMQEREAASKKFAAMFGL
jgi:hypothetical protein